MAVARPVRFLGAISVVLFIFLIYQFFRSPLSLHAPRQQDAGLNGDKIESMDRDPLLDRVYFTHGGETAIS